MSAPNSNISKIHVNSSTALSLNDRFTKMHMEQIVSGRKRSRSRSRSRSRAVVPVDSQVSIANQRLLEQLARKHTVATALKLKRRSMRTAATANGNGMGYATRARAAGGAVKTLRLAANGRPIRTNSRTRIPTMKADLINSYNQIRRPLRRRAASMSRFAAHGQQQQQQFPQQQRLLLGGAAERIARRRLQQVNVQRGRSRSRQRTLTAMQANKNVLARVGRARSRSRSRQPITNNNNNNNMRARSQSQLRTRPAKANYNNMPAARGRGRARERSVSRNRSSIKDRLPITARLGYRKGAAANAPQRLAANNGMWQQRNRSRSRNRVANGGVQKRRNFNQTQMAKRTVGAAAGGNGRIRGRSAVRNVGLSAQPRGRSRSRARRGTAPMAKGAVMGVGQRQNKRMGRLHNNGQNQQHQQQQQQRGRSRLSRDANRRGRNIGKNNNNRNAGNNAKAPINKDDLDKELDQYMSTTKTENNMDFLLR